MQSKGGNSGQARRGAEFGGNSCYEYSEDAPLPKEGVNIPPQLAGLIREKHADLEGAEGDSGLKTTNGKRRKSEGCVPEGNDAELQAIMDGVGEESGDMCSGGAMAAASNVSTSDMVRNVQNRARTELGSYMRVMCMRLNLE